MVVSPNEILSGLPAEEFKRMAPHFEPVVLRAGQTVQPAGKMVESVFFPENGMVSQASVLADGSRFELAVVGRRGFVGTGALRSDRVSVAEALCQVEARTLR